MVFSSATFLFLFLPVVLGLYFVTPGRYRNLLLLLVSLTFYFWGENFLVWIIIFSTFVDYFCGLVMSGGWRRRPVAQLEPGGPRTAVQRLALVASVCTNLAVLGYFKYFNFGVDSFNAGVAGLGVGSWTIADVIRVTLPLGVSFYTFQSMSYSIDVYRGEVKATRNLIDFAAFVTMFPQLVAGPIVRYRDVAAQLVQRQVTRSGFAAGIERFVVGLAKKVLIANTVAVTAEAIFGLPAASLTAPVAWLGVVAYTLQIYFDFSGYSDMAIGLGLMFGFRFPENFNFPYVSRSIQEFWRRWHMSLSTWFRDYLYIPLGGSRVSPLRTYLNLWVVFLLCGLWHGASWSFVVWGAYHGLFLVLERAGGLRLLQRSPRAVQHVYSLLVVMVGWVFFRADTLGHAVSYLGVMVGVGGAPDPKANPLAMYLQNDVVLAVLIGAVGSAPVVAALGRRLGASIERARRGGALAVELSVATARLVSLAALFALVAAGIASGSYNPFIYFRF